MRKYILTTIASLMLLSLVGGVFASSKDFDFASTGGTGIIVYPSIDVSRSFEIGLGLQWVLFPGSVLSPVLSIAFQNFNFGVAADYDTGRSGGVFPVIFSAKYQITSGLGIYGDLQWFTRPNDIGFSFLLLGGDGLFGLSIGGGWDLTFGFGIAFAPNYDWNLNVFFGIQKSILSDVLFLKAELANYSYRVIYDPFFSSDGRGVFNLGLSIVPANWVSIGITGFDLLDNNRSLGVSLNFRFKP
ncbi:MAG: hypothetical protein N3D81_04735 [Spirochaetes bacterium]|nr:hypothetical protein [Spirochaetota bacterium]